MRLLDEQYTRTPFYGVLKMTDWLDKQGHPVNLKRVRRLMRLMGLEAIYARPRLSDPAPGHRIYPYLLRGLAIEKPDACWATDISVPQKSGVGDERRYQPDLSHPACRSGMQTTASGLGQKPRS
jgi:transposase InsO family protein